MREKIKLEMLSKPKLLAFIDEIAHISTFLQGGAGKMIVNLAKDTKARGDSVWIACTKDAGKRLL